MTKSFSLSEQNQRFSSLQLISSQLLSLALRDANELIRLQMCSRLLASGRHMARTFLFSFASFPIAWWENYRPKRIYFRLSKGDLGVSAIRLRNCNAVCWARFANFARSAPNNWRLVSCLRGAVRWNWNFYSCAPESEARKAIFMTRTSFWAAIGKQKRFSAAFNCLIALRVSEIAKADGVMTENESRLRTQKGAGTLTPHLVIEYHRGAHITRASLVLFSLAIQLGDVFHSRKSSLVASASRP